MQAEEIEEERKRLKKQPKLPTLNCGVHVYAQEKGRTLKLWGDMLERSGFKLTLLKLGDGKRRGSCAHAVISYNDGSQERLLAMQLLCSYSPVEETNFERAYK